MLLLNPKFTGAAELTEMGLFRPRSGHVLGAVEPSHTVIVILGTYLVWTNLCSLF